MWTKLREILSMQGANYLDIIIFDPR